MELLAKQSLKGRIRSKLCLTGHIALGVVEDNSQVIILEDESGNRVAAYLSDEEVTLTATANDIRAGSVAVTNSGVTTGEKVIPSYNTLEGYRKIKSGRNFEIPNLGWLNLYDFTKLQIVICLYNDSISNSVSVDRVVINEKVYPVNSIEVISQVERDSINKKINLGILNDGNEDYVLRYFMYKEIN